MPLYVFGGTFTNNCGSFTDTIGHSAVVDPGFPLRWGHQHTIWYYAFYLMSVPAQVIPMQCEYTITTNTFLIKCLSDLILI